MTWNNVRARVWTQRRINATREPLRVLVVDDNREAAEALATYLTFENLTLYTAFGGREAIETCLACKPQLVIMDITMPECSGFEAALALRDDPRTAHIGIIAFTALDESEVRRHLQDHEFDGYCQKGQPPSKLVTLLKFMQEDS
jgi:two-component system, OmpR family, response regulator